jgi:integrase
MLSIRRRGKSFHVDFLAGTARLRGSLGTRNQDAARRLVHRLGIALSEGAGSSLWTELKKSLPISTYTRFADTVGAKDRQPPTWNDLRQSFSAYMKQRITIGKLSQTTSDRYEVTIREFESFLEERNIKLLKDIGKSVVESFKVWRLDRIKKRKQSRGGTGLVLDVAVLHRMFAIGVENEMIVKNPVKMEGRPGENPQVGAQPFSGTDLSKLRENSGEDLLAFLLLRWTGLRGGDAVGLAWQEVHFDRKEIERVTQKRNKRVIIPIQSELLFMLEAEQEQRKPTPSDRVLLNPATGKALTRPRLYQRILSLGRRAGLSNAHPHRFRDTLAVDMLARGASPYDVAKVLGDTIETVERHYTPFVRELRERVRLILETGIGIENPPQTASPATQNVPKKPN